MPNKTKRQKILAEKRRHTTSTLSSNAPSVPVPEINTPAPVFRFQGSHVPSIPADTAYDREELTVIQKDLTKTLILALIAILIELGMYQMLRGA